MLFIGLAALVALLVPFLWPLVWSFTPPRSQGPDDEKAQRLSEKVAEALGNPDLARPRQSPVETIFAHVVLVGTAVFAGVLGCLFLWLYEVKLSQLPEPIFLFRSTEAQVSCFAAAVLPGMMLSAVVAFALLSLFIKRRAMIGFIYAEKFGDISASALTRSYLTWAAFCGVVSSTVLIWMMPCHRRADDSAITICEPWMWREAVYPVADITRLAVSSHGWDPASKGRVRNWPEVHVWLADGRSFGMQGLWGDELEEFVGWLERKTGKWAERVKMPEDVGR